ncbi:hypothetical protein JDS87_23955 [Bacillus cereus]|uniref:hypothetical protein n=1 Tax=Bacillus cereus TaxID=1396 RepID=UPI0018F6B182|nr:hypothetical protein [Bacillus cereus]MBJ8054920.1 hypothetical protein [Bacillus cereus]
MVHLQVLDGMKKKKINYSNIHFEMVMKSIEKVFPLQESYACKDELKRFVFNGVKFIASFSESETFEEEVKIKTIVIRLTEKVMSHLTPKEFEMIFPIDKTYDGKKREVKDYFYTKEYIRNFGEHNIIGDKIDDFLWEYHNIHISLFVVDSLSVISKMNRLNTGKSLIEEVFPNLKTYTMHETSDGRKFMKDNKTGEVSRVTKIRPRYLKIIE